MRGHRPKRAAEQRPVLQVVHREDCGSLVDVSRQRLAALVSVRIGRHQRGELMVSISPLQPAETG